MWEPLGAPPTTRVGRPTGHNAREPQRSEGLRKRSLTLARRRCNSHECGYAGRGSKGSGEIAERYRRRQLDCTCDHQSVASNSNAEVDGQGGRIPNCWRARHFSSTSRSHDAHSAPRLSRTIRRDARRDVNPSPLDKTSSWVVNIGGAYLKVALTKSKSNDV